MSSNPLQFTTRKSTPLKITFGKISLGSSTATAAKTVTGTGNDSNDSKPAALGNDDSVSVEAASPQGFSTFSFKKPDVPKQSPQISSNPVEVDDEEMNRVMGFSSFITSTSKAENSKTKKKSARNFDIKEMTDAIRKSKLQERAEKAAETIPDFEEDLDNLEVQDSSKSGSPLRSLGDDEDVESDITSDNPQKLTVALQSNVRRKSDVSDDDDATDEEGVSSEDDDEVYKPNFPVQFKTTLSHSEKPVTAFAVDPTGTRFATGSLDYEVKLWDFTGLKNGHAFRAMKPCESHVIRNLSYSNNGEALLIISGNCQAKVVNRDGIEILECVKGDQYIVDMARTKGHVATLTGGQFNPKSRETFLTCSEDGTCRLWDVNNPRQHKTCVKLRGLSGMKNPATACCYGRDGNQIYAGGLDGCINMWDTRRKLVVPTSTIKSAHARNTDIFGICTSHSGKFVASRGEDAVLNIWDTRNFTKPIFREGDFSAKYNTTDLTFSPDDRHLLVPTLPSGTTGRDKEEGLKYSELRFLRMKNFSVDPATTMKFPKDIIIRAAWNHRINQMFFTFASGSFKISYDLVTSRRGALLCHGQKPKKEKPSDMMEDPTNRIIITPNALPLFKTDRPRNKKREEAKARMDPLKSKRPELPITAGTAGRVGTSGSTLSSYVIRNLGMSKSVKDDMDPREAILRFAKDAAENPIWITPAYQKTQPTPIFQQSEGADEPDEKKRKVV